MRIRRRRRRNNVCRCYQPIVRKLLPQNQIGKIACKNPQILYRHELEAIKLHDVDELSHTEAASHMGISQPTYSRLLSKSYKTIANALVHGHEIHIIDEEVV